MTRPHEETWRYDAFEEAVMTDEPLESPDFPMFGAHVAEMYGSPDVMAERGALIAAAPAMARLLLRFEWRTNGRGTRCLACGYSRFTPDGNLSPSPHSDVCEWVAAMRAAGVRP